jgi:hypothetical protein
VFYDKTVLLKVSANTLLEKQNGGFVFSFVLIFINNPYTKGNKISSSPKRLLKFNYLILT